MVVKDIIRRIGIVVDGEPAIVHVYTNRVSVNVES